MFYEYIVHAFRLRGYNDFYIHYKRVEKGWYS